MEPKKDPNIKSMGWSFITFDIMWLVLIYLAFTGSGIAPLTLIVKGFIWFTFILSILVIPAHYITYRNVSFKKYDSSLPITRTPSWYAIISVISKVSLFFFLTGNIVYTMMWIFGIAVVQANYRHVLEMHDKWYTHQSQFNSLMKVLRDKKDTDDK